MSSADHRRSLGRLARRALLAGLLAVSSLGSGVHAARPAAKPGTVAPGKVVESRFGLEKGGAIEGQDEPVVPLQDGVVYGWSVRLAPPYRAVRVSERLVLPGPAKWDIDAPYKRLISNDRMSCLLEMSLTPDADGWISNTWNVSADDPAGRGSCTITIGNQPPVTFRVTFVRPGKEDKPAAGPEATPVEAPAPAATEPADTANANERAALRELDRQLDEIHSEVIPATTKPSR